MSYLQFCRAQDILNKHLIRHLVGNRNVLILRVSTENVWPTHPCELGSSLFRCTDHARILLNVVEEAAIFHARNTYFRVILDEQRNARTWNDNLETGRRRWIARDRGSRLLVGTCRFRRGSTRRNERGIPPVGSLSFFLGENAWPRDA